MANVFGQLETVEDVEPLRSYEEWHDEGRQVMMGEKARAWRTAMPRNIPLFHIHQTQSIEDCFNDKIRGEIRGWGKPW